MSVQGVRGKGRDSAGNDSVKTWEEFVEAAEQQQQEEKRRGSVGKTLPGLPAPAPPPVFAGNGSTEKKIPKVLDGEGEINRRRKREEDLRSSRGLTALEARLSRTKSPANDSTSTTIPISRVEQTFSPPLVPLNTSPVISTVPAISTAPSILPTIKPIDRFPIPTPIAVIPTPAPPAPSEKPKRSFESPWTARTALSKTAPSQSIETKGIDAGVTPLVLPTVVGGTDGLKRGEKEVKASRRATVDFTKLPSSTSTSPSLDRNRSPLPVVAPTAKPSLAPAKSHPTAPPAPNRRFSLDQYRSPSYPAPPPPSSSTDPNLDVGSLQEDEERAYDIRSARGGKGGKVSQVKNSWEIFGASTASPFINTTSGKIAQLSSTSNMNSKAVDKKVEPTGGKRVDGEGEGEKGRKVKVLLMRFQS